MLLKNNDQLTHILKNGGVIAYPTEAVYGLGCDALNESAVTKIFTIKQRSREKGLISLAPDIDTVLRYTEKISETCWQRIHSTWPGATTWLFPANHNAPLWITGDSNKIAIRLSAHPIASLIVKNFGGLLVSTSANVSHMPALRTLEEVTTQFHSLLDAIVPGLVGGNINPSEIRDALTGEVVRAA